MRTTPSNVPITAPVTEADLKALTRAAEKTASEQTTSDKATPYDTAPEEANQSLRAKRTYKTLNYDNPLVSVIMPSYNLGRFLPEAIGSVLNQSYLNWELIIVDDASTDDTREILNSYQARPQITVLKNPTNLGVSASRNRGVELAQGEWIAFLDSDDVWHSEKLKRQLKLLKKTRGKFSCTQVRLMDEGGQPKQVLPSPPHEIPFKELLKQNVIALSSALIHRNLITQVQQVQAHITPHSSEDGSANQSAQKSLDGPFEDRGNEDYALWIRVLNQGERCFALSEPLTLYRVRKNSRSSGKIKSALNNWKIYKEVAGLSTPRALKSLIHYAARSLNTLRYH